MLSRTAAAALAAALCAAGTAGAEQFVGIAEARVWIGVDIDSGEVGVLVTGVFDESPAQSAGLLPGDEILAVDGRRIAEPIDLQQLIAGTRAGSKVELRVMRDERTFRVEVAPEAMPDRNEILRRRLVDKPAPDFEVEVLNGGTKGELAALRGKVIVVEIWATYCTACELTHASLSELATARARDGLAVLAISRESEAVLRHYLGKYRPTFSVARDADGAASRAFHAYELPTLVVIDRRGIVRYAGVSDDAARTGLSARQAVEANVAAAVFAAERLLGASKGPTRERRPGRAAQ